MAGYMDRQIQKMGRWRSDTFKEYISDQLSTFSDGMSTDMKKTFNFVNIAGGELAKVTRAMLAPEYSSHASAVYMITLIHHILLPVGAPTIMKHSSSWFEE